MRTSPAAPVHVVHCEGRPPLLDDVDVARGGISSFGSDGAELTILARVPVSASL